MYAMFMFFYNKKQKQKSVNKKTKICVLSCKKKQKGKKCQRCFLRRSVNSFFFTCRLDKTQAK